MLRNRYCVRSRRGTSVIELLVAAGLLVTAVGLVGTTSLAARRVLADGQHYSLAVSELSNQLERLCLMTEAERERALQELTLPAEFSRRLPDAALEAELLDDQYGQRLRLSLDWSRMGDPPAVVLVAWLPDPQANTTSALPERSDESATDPTRLDEPVAEVEAALDRDAQR